MSNPRILLVEDEKALRDHLFQTLWEEKFDISVSSTYAELLRLIEAREKHYDVIVMDRLLYGRDSSKLIGDIKKGSPNTSILIISAIGTAVEKASVLGMGADDYLSKPFDPVELIARIRVLLRRSVPKFSLANVTLNLETRAMVVDGKDVALTNKEFVLLKTLVEVPGKVFSKATLYKRVWDMSTEVDSNVIEVTVAKLRGRFKDANAKIRIKNMRNIGYWVEE
jgi:DNA-binding response OmpR family regulator